MSRDLKPSTPPPPWPPSAARGKAAVDLVSAGDAAIVTISGQVDEKFTGFGDVGQMKTVVINVAGMTRMTSFGVRQWLKAMDGLPKAITDLYLIGCPTFFVDQLNMVLNFGGGAKVLTVVAPYTCPSCGVESGETIDVLVERANLAKGGLPEKECSRCAGKLEFDETPESYFAFVAKYAATNLSPGAAQLLAVAGLHTSVSSATEKPPRIIKLVHGSVTYFRIIGTIGSMFRSRPFLVGAEGEVVIDLAEVDRFDPAGHKEWKRLLKTLAAQVPSVTLVDVTESFLSVAGDTLATARNISVASVLVPYGCVECQRTSYDSETLLTAHWPRDFEDHVCSTCGGRTQNRLPATSLVPLHKASTSTLPASAKLIDQRDEILSRAMTDAKVAQAGDGAVAQIGTDDTILGKYKIVRRLSEGGMAEVFVAKQVGIGGFEKPVALKRIQRKLLDTRHLAIELFLNEAKIAGRLTHPNIVQVLDVGEVGGALYLAMEYVHGKDLRNVIRKVQQSGTTVPLGEACYIIREVAQALNHAYWSTDMNGKRLNVVHRDVSPQNVIIGYDGTVKLLDFGVAMSAVTEHAETMIVGKWLYMSPETTLNEKIDHRSDLFSLGVNLYLLCSGKMPFSGREPREIVKKIRAGEFKPLHEFTNVPPRLADLVSRMLASNPDHRPQKGSEVVAELNEIMRAHGIESSGPRVAEYLTSLFPYEAGGTDNTEAPRLEMIRASGTFDAASPGPTSAPHRIAEGSAPGGRSETSSRSMPVTTPPQTFEGAATVVAQPPPAGHGVQVPNAGPVVIAPWQPQGDAKVTKGLRTPAIVAGVVIVIAVILYLLVRPA